MLNTADWDLQPHAAQAGHIVALGAQGAEPPGIGVVEGGEIPYLPAALPQKQANFSKRFTDDPEIKCYMPGVPRATYLPFPFQIFQSPKVIQIAYEFASSARTIFMEKMPPAPLDSWMGQSVGHWEGDTLVVDVTGLLDQTWLDRVGDFHSDALHVVERYTPRNHDVLQYEATIEDPKVFSRPWKITMPLYIDSGDHDDFNIEGQAPQLYEIWREHKQPAELRITGGTHSFGVWKTTIHEAMRFIFETVRRPELLN